MFCLEGTSFWKKCEDVEGCYAKMREDSMGKDTTVGHWEIAGMISEKPLPTYPEGFPKEVIDAFSQAAGRACFATALILGQRLSKIMEESMSGQVI